MKADKNLNPDFKEFLTLLLEEKNPLLSKDHLIRNKRASGRARDLLDLENLQ